MIRHIKTFYNYRFLLWEFVKKDIKLKYRNSFLGILWSMLNPLLIMVVLTFIFSNVFKKIEGITPSDYKNKSKD